MQVQDLGKGLIEGHEVEGKRDVLSATQKPAAHAQDAEAPANAQGSAVASISESGSSAQATAADRCGSLDQHQTENIGADQGDEFVGITDHLLQTHFLAGAPSFDVRDSIRI
jgi:hypothetical protein